MNSITIENTSNPNVKKFSFSQRLFAESKEYNSSTSTENFPLAQSLLQMPFVVAVLKMPEAIAIQKNEKVEWEDVADELKEMIGQALQNIPPLSTNNRAIEVYIEGTPNPNVIKLVSNQLLYDTKAEAQSLEEAQNFPLAQEILKWEGVQSVFVQENYVSLTKKETEEWKLNDFEIREFLSQYLKAGKEVVNSAYQAQSIDRFREKSKPFGATEQKIQQILQEYIKPAVAGDGGDIDLVDYDSETKTARMLLQGACNGCPSSTITLKNGIEQILKEMMPNQIDNVVAINS